VHRAALAALGIALLLVACRPGQDVVLGRDGPPSADSIPPIAGQYSGTFSAPPTLVDTTGTTDAPLLGNGDLGVAILNSIDTMTFILHKTEFWSLAERRVKAMARVSLSIPGMTGSSYSMSENIGSADVTGSFELGGDAIITKTWVQADDTQHNQMFTTFHYAGTTPKDVTVSLAPGHDNTFQSAVASAGFSVLATNRYRRTVAR